MELKLIENFVNSTGSKCEVISRLDRCRNISRAETHYSMRVALILLSATLRIDIPNFGRAKERERDGDYSRHRSLGIRETYEERRSRDR